MSSPDADPSGSPPVTVRVRQHVDWRTLVEVHSRLDARAAPVLREELVRLDRDGEHHLVTGLSGVPGLTAAGLGVPAGALKRVQQADGSLHLVRGQPAVLRALRTSGVLGLFTLHPSFDDVPPLESSPPHEPGRPAPGVTSS